MLRFLHAHFWPLWYVGMAGAAAAVGLLHRSLRRAGR